MAGSSSRIGLYADDHISPVLRKLRTDFAGLNQSKGAQSILQGVGIGAGISTWNLLQSAISNVGDVITDSIAKAREEEASIGRLDASLKANIKGWDGNRDAMEAVIADREKLAFSDQEQRDGLALLVASTHDVTKALNLQRIAMDLARLRGTDLVETSTLISKVYQGNLTSLKRFGIALGDVKTGAEALAKIQAMAAGQADAYAKTNVGATESLNIAFNDLEETLGGLVTGPMTDLVKTGADDVRALDALATSAKQFGAELPDMGIDLGFVGENIGTWVQHLIDAKGQMTGLKLTLTDQIMSLSTYKGAWDHGTASIEDWSSAAGTAIEDSVTLTRRTADLRKQVDDAAKSYSDWAGDIKDATSALNDQKRGTKETSLKIEDLNLDIQITQDKLHGLRKIPHPTLQQQQDMVQLRLRIKEDRDELALLNSDLSTTGKFSMKTTISQINALQGSVHSADAQVRKLVMSLALAADNAAIAALGGKPPKAEKGHAGGGGAASGGYRGAGWSGTVGEEGTERMTLLPGGGAYITPHSGGGGGGTPVVIALQVDGREMARVVDRHLYYEAARAPQSPYAG